MAQAAIILAVEAEGDAGHLKGSDLVLFGGHGFRGVDFLAGDDVGEVLVEGLDGGGGGGVFEADDELVGDRTHGVVVAVEAGYMFDGFVGAFGDVVEVQVGWADQLLAQKVFAGVLVPGAPIGGAWGVDEDKGAEAGLAR